MKALLFFILCAISVNIYSQARLSGYVFDNETGERLIGANIFDINSKKGTVANQYGYYSVSLKSDSSCQLRVSFIGYKTIVLNLELKQDTVINFRLSPSITLNEVEVSAERPIEKNRDECNSNTCSAA